MHPQLVGQREVEGALQWDPRCPLVKVVVRLTGVLTRFFALLDKSRTTNSGLDKFIY